MNGRRRAGRTLHAKRLALFLVLVAVSTGSVYAIHKSMIRKSATAMLRQAEKAKAEGNIGEAVKLYQDYLNFQSRDADALEAYAQLLETVSATRPRARQERADTLERVLRVDPSREQSRRDLAKLYLEMGLFSQANNHYDELLEGIAQDSPEAAELQFEAAVCDVYQGQPQRASEHLRKTLASGHAKAEAYVLLAHVLKNQINTPESLAESDEVMRKLIADRPEDPQARLAMARHLLNRRQYSEARQELEKAAAAGLNTTSDPELARLRAELYLAENKLADARGILQSAIEANPENARLRLMLADVHYRLDDRTRATEELNRVTSLVPSDAPALLDVLDKKIDYGMLNQARQDIGTYLQGEDYSAIADYLHGRILLAEGNWPEARDRLERTLTPFERFPKYLSKTHLALAACYQQANNYDRMLEVANAALRADPLHVAPRLAVADAQALLGNWDSALPTFRQLADQYPQAKQAYLRYTLAQQLALPRETQNWTGFDSLLGNPPHSAEAMILKARSLAARADFSAALATLDEATMARPSEPEPHIWKALFLANSDRSAALESLEEATRTIGDRADFRLAKARILTVGDQPADAATLKSLGENAAGFRDDERFLLYAGLGDLFSSRLKDWATATTFYEQAARAQPFHLAARIAWFRSALRAENFPAMDQALSELRKLDGSNGVTYRTHAAMKALPGLTADQRNQAQTLRQSVAEALPQRPSWSLPYMVLGELDERLNDPESALENYQQAVDRGEQSDRLVRRLIRLYFQRGRLDDARRVLERATRSGTLPGDLQQQQALANASLGQGTAELSALVKANADSRNPADQLFRGQAALLLGDRREAVTAFEKALDLNPQLIEGWSQLVRLHALNNDRAAAEAIAKRAEQALQPLSERQPEGTQVLIALGDIQQLLGRLTAAEQHFLRAEAQSPEDSLPTRRLIELWLQSQRIPDARKRLETLSQQAGKPVDARWARQRLAELLVSLPQGHKNLDQALALLQQNITSGQPDAVRARAFLMARDPFRRAEARELIAGTLKEKSLNADESMSLAQLAYQQGDLAYAENLMRDACRSPSIARLEHMAFLHKLLLERDRLPQAREVLTQIQRFGPKGWEVLTLEARQLTAEDQRDAAAQRLVEFARDQEPQWIVTRLVPLLAELGARSEAEKQLLAACESPRMPQPKQALARGYVLIGMPQQALATLEKLGANELSPPEQARIMTAAVALQSRAMLSGEDASTWDQTLTRWTTWVNQQLQATPGEPELVQCSAVLADSLRDYPLAIRQYQRLISVAPETIAGRNNLAFLLAVINKDSSPQALESIQHAIDRAGPIPSLIDTRGLVHLAAGRVNEAIRDLETVTQVDQNPRYYFHLALAYERTGNTPKQVAAIDAATRLRLQKSMLHPGEWPAFERFFGPR